MYLKVGSHYLDSDLIKHFSVHINTTDKTIEVKFFNGYPNLLASQIFHQQKLHLNFHQEKLAYEIVQFLHPYEDHPINIIKSLDEINEKATKKYEGF